MHFGKRLSWESPRARVTPPPSAGSVISIQKLSMPFGVSQGCVTPALTGLCRAGERCVPCHSSQAEKMRCPCLISAAAFLLWRHVYNASPCHINLLQACNWEGTMLSAKGQCSLEFCSRPTSSLGGRFFIEASAFTLSPAQVNRPVQGAHSCSPSGIAFIWRSAVIHACIMLLFRACATDAAGYYAFSHSF